MHAKELVSACFFLSFYAAITIQFEQDMYMVQESEGMVDIRVVTSGRTSFDYTFTVTSMDITATSKYMLMVFNSSENYINLLINVQVLLKSTLSYYTPYSFSMQTLLTTSSHPPHCNSSLLLTTNQSLQLSYQFPSFVILITSLMKHFN